MHVAFASVVLSSVIGAECCCCGGNVKVGTRFASRLLRSIFEEVQVRGRGGGGCACCILLVCGESVLRDVTRYERKVEVREIRVELKITYYETIAPVKLHLPFAFTSHSRAKPGESDITSP